MTAQGPGILRRLAARIAGRHPEPQNPRLVGHLLDCGEFRFLVDNRDAFVGAALQKMGECEPEERAQIATRIDAGSDVLFVGAHIGALAIPVARLCRRIAMVEANPDTYRLLAANCALNVVQNADLHNVAAGEGAGQIRFVKNTHNSGGSKREPAIAERMYYYDDPQTVEVPLRALDDVFPGRSFDLAVMDIEGSETFALKGMTHLLSTLPCLIVEFVPHHLRNVAQVSVPGFLEPILPHFRRMTVPSLGRTAEGADIAPLLEQMYEAGQTDGGLIFEKGGARG